MTRRLSKGRLIVLGMFLVGGVMLWVMFVSPRAMAPPAPLSATFGVPDRPVRFVSYNILHGQRGLERIASEIRALEPDIVLLQEVESRDSVGLADLLDMRFHFHPRLYQRSENLAGRKASWGNLILSRHPIYESRSIPNPGGGSFGVWAVAVVAGKKFFVANVHLSATWNANPAHLKESGVNRHKELAALRDASRERGSPPMVVGGDFNQIPMGNNYALMTQDWTDMLAALGKTQTTFAAGFLRTRIDYFLTTRDWRAVEGGVATSGASDHQAIWAVLRGADVTSAMTKSTTQFAPSSPQPTTH